MNAINEIVTYMLMLYMARNTYVTRSSIYGIISSLFVILEGVIKDRVKDEEEDRWYIAAFTWIEIIAFLIGYSLIVFERV